MNKRKRNDARLRIGLAHRRAVRTWPTSRFNHDNASKFERDNTKMCYVTHVEELMPYPDHYGAWLRVRARRTVHADFYCHPYTRLVKLYSYDRDTARIRVVEDPSYHWSVRPRPRDMV